MYGDINLNYRDGSAIWLASIAECLKRAGSEVYLLLKADVRDPERLTQLESVGVHILGPFDHKQSGFAGMGAREAAQRIAVLDRRYNFEVILSRGFGIASHLAVSGRFTNRMWPYLTEGPAFRYDRTEHEIELLDRIGDEARRVFVQTEEARSMLEAMMPTATGKTLLMHPIIPDEAFELEKEKSIAPVPSAPLSLVYAGKFARLWNTLEICDLPRQLERQGFKASLHMIGDKFQLTDNDHDWLNAMQDKYEAFDPDVTWHGGRSRREVFALIKEQDIGICWRHEDLDASPEVSTKMLEYSAIGTPPLLNRSGMHEQLLGDDYPLFIENNDPVSTLKAVAEDRSLLRKARSMARNMAHTFSMSCAIKRFQSYFQRAEGHADSAVEQSDSKSSTRVLLAGHDFKFAADLMESLAQRKDINFRVDKWPRLAVHDKDASQELINWAEVVVCEWAGPNAVFYSRHLREGQRLIIRFHGFEVRGAWLKDIDINKVDAVVFVSDFYRKEVLHATGWPEHKTTVIYNAVDHIDLHRPKEAGAKFRIAMAGYVPLLKRPDRAVELLKSLLEYDTRYYLHIRGRAPWNYPWEWDKPIQQDGYRKLFAEIAQDPLLSQHVVFEKFGPDMGSWYRRFGWVLSPSTRETFHLAPVEGMLSGAVPVVWRRTGADEIFGDEFIHADTRSAAEFILENSREDVYTALSHRAVNKASDYEIMVARNQWINLILAQKGTALNLNGTSILEGVKIPRDQAEVTAMFYRVAVQSGIREGVEAVREYRHLLSAELRQSIDAWLEMLSWVKNPATVLAPESLQPLYVPVPLTYLEIGRRIQRLAGFRAVPTRAPKSVGTFRDDIMIAADTFVRRARMERPQFIVASGPVGVCLSALIAARRLGIPFYRGEVDNLEGQTFTDEVFVALRGLIIDNSQDYRGTLFSRFRSGIPIAKSESEMLHHKKIGLIADEFTMSTISATVPTVALDRQEWPQQLEGLDAVIVESAWEGKDNQWFHGVAYHGEDEADSLWRLLEECAKRNIPTIFWNKEDPVHFRSFVAAAGRCDHIFTTDAGILPSYMSSAERTSATVSSLSFFAQPRLHNPLPGDRAYENTVAFAGTYYGDRYKQRSEELKQILMAASNYGLKIYDRQHLRPNSPYQFPEELQKYSFGSVPYSEMLEVYKSHPLHINVNSVENSPSMFSRRVVEIAASGSIVLSGRGRGIIETLGPNFPVMTSPDEWHRKLKELLSDDKSRLVLTWNQMRTIFRSHRADQAIALMLRTAGIVVAPSAPPRYGWFIEDPSDITLAVRQTIPPVVITSDRKTISRANDVGLETVSPHETEEAGIEFVGFPLDDVSTTHCEDLLLVNLFTDSDQISPARPSHASFSIFSKGEGDVERGLWSAFIGRPAEARNPYRVVLPDHNFPQ